MKPIAQLSLILLGIDHFLLGGAAAPALHHAINKRSGEEVPSEIQDWKLYQAWNSELEQRPPELVVPVPESVSDGRLDETDKTKLLYKSDCDEDRVATMQQKVSANWATVFKGTLSPSEVDTVAIKRSWALKDMVVYGGSLQAAFSDSPYVMPVLDIVYQKEGRKAGYLIMPWISEGSLESHFDSYIDQANVNDAFKKIIKAVKLLHDKNIMHRDLKPENFMVDGDDLKLTDFDYATTQSDSREYNLGTVGYLAPEILGLGVNNKDPYDKKVDVFSLGMIWLVMSIPELQNNNKRLLLWKDLIEKDGKQWLSPDQIEDRLKSYEVFQDNSELLKVIAKALCRPGVDRYSVTDFQSAFNDATK